MPDFVYAEDDPMSREIMKFILEYAMMAKNVAVFEDTANFMERVQSLSFTPSVFLLDIHIEPHTGIEVLHMLKGHDTYSNIPVIALTASVMNEEIQNLKEVGFDGAIAKPVNVEVLPGLINQILQGETVWHIS